MNRSVDNLVALEFAKMLRQHLLGRAGDQSLQFAKAARSRFKMENNQGLPFPADNVCREFHGTFEVVHRIPRIPGDQKVPTSQKETLT